MSAKEQIRNLLRGDAYGFSVATIASYLDIPQASVRRNIGELRKQGWSIEPRNGNYVMTGDYARPRT